MRAFVRGLTARKDVEVHLISHATSNRDVRDDDGQAADRFAAEFPGTIRVPDFAGPCEAKSYISSLDYLVAGRSEEHTSELQSLMRISYAVFCLKKKKKKNKVYQKHL